MAIALRYVGSGHFEAASQQAMRNLTADGEFERNQVYAMEAVEDRSPASHAHLFAVIADAWHSSDAMIERYPSPEHLRKALLVRAGWCDSFEMVLRTPADAIMAAGHIQRKDTYAVITVNDNVVSVFSAKSMSRRAMKKADFQWVKDLILNHLTTMTGADCAGEYARKEAA